MLEHLGEANVSILVARAARRCVILWAVLGLWSPQPVVSGGMDPDQAAQHLADRMTSKKEGDVGKVSGETLYIALGEQDGILEGSQFDIVRLGDPILVGERQIGREEKLVAKAEANRVRAQMTVAKQIAMLERPRKGDRAYLARSPVKRLLVAPFLSNSSVTGLSRSLQENLITLLIRKGWPVVERSQLERVLEEQKLGYSGLVSLDSAKKLGQLLGADTLMLGTLTDLGDTVVVNARLVALKTGTSVSGAQARIAKTPVVGQLLARVFEERRTTDGKDDTARRNRTGPNTATRPSQSDSGKPVFQSELIRVTLSGASVSNDRKNLNIALRFENISGDAIYLTAITRDSNGDKSIVALDDKGGVWHLNGSVVGMSNINSYHKPRNGPFSLFTKNQSLPVSMAFSPKSNSDGKNFVFSGLFGVKTTDDFTQFSVGLDGIRVE